MIFDGIVMYLMDDPWNEHEQMRSIKSGVMIVLIFRLQKTRQS